MKKATKKKIQSLFTSLIEACKQKEAYSVLEIAEKMGIKYKQIKKWAKSNKWITYRIKNS